jgi:hypothetical protein
LGAPELFHFNTMVIDMRVRRDSTNYVAGCSNWTGCLDGSHLTAGAFNNNTWHLSYHHDYMFDTPHPGFYSRIKKGELIIGPYVCGLDTYTGAGGSLHAQVTANPSYYWDFAGNSVTLSWAYDNQVKFPTTVLGLTSDEAKLQALAGIDPTQFAFMEDILSMRQNLDMIREPLLKIHKIIRNKPGGNLKNLRGEDLYLYYRFALTPFINSLSDAIKAWKVGIVPTQANVRLRSTGRCEKNFSESKTFTAKLHHNFSSNENRSESYRAVVYYSVTRIRDDIGRLLGTRLQDIPVGLWAVMPYSFMVDRFLDISKMLKALMNLSNPTVKVEGGCVTFKQVWLNQLQYLGPQNLNDGWSYTVNADIATQKGFLINRSVWLPSVQDAVPAVNLQGLISDSIKTADLVALILQRLR